MATVPNDAWNELSLVLHGAQLKCSDYLFFEGLCFKVAGLSCQLAWVAIILRHLVAEWFLVPHSCHATHTIPDEPHEFPQNPAQWKGTESNSDFVLNFGSYRFIRRAAFNFHRTHTQLAGSTSWHIRCRCKDAQEEDHAPTTTHPTTHPLRPLLLPLPLPLPSSNNHTTTKTTTKMVKTRSDIKIVIHMTGCCWVFVCVLKHWKK